MVYVQPWMFRGNEGSSVRSQMVCKGVEVRVVDVHVAGQIFMQEFVSHYRPVVNIFYYL